MISVMETDSGNFNVLGFRDGAIVLQGNLTTDELAALQRAIESVAAGDRP